MYIIYPMRFRVVTLFLSSDIRRESKKKKKENGENKRTNDYQIYMLYRAYAYNLFLPYEK